MNDEETLPHKIGSWAIFFLVVLIFGLCVYGLFNLFKGDIPIQTPICNVTGHPEAKLSYFMEGYGKQIKCCYTESDNNIGKPICEALK